MTIKKGKHSRLFHKMTNNIKSNIFLLLFYVFESNQKNNFVF